MKKYIFIVLLFFHCSVRSQIISLIAGGGFGGDGTSAISATVFDINGLVVDKYGNIYFVESLNSKVRKVDTNGIISTIAGTGSHGYNGDNIPAVSAQLNQPDLIAVDTIGNVYIGDGINNRVRKITVSTGIITTIAGNGTAGFSGDGNLAVNAALNLPSSLCFDKMGNMYIGDNANKRIRKVDNSGVITTYAGNGQFGWDGDGGPAIMARCNPSNAMCTDNAGNLYVAEGGNYVVRKITTQGIISTIAGDTSSFTYNSDGILAIHATLAPFGLAFDDSGLLYISDVNNNRVRKIDGNGIIHTIAGTGVRGYSGDGGPAISATLNFPSGIAFDNCGNLLVAQVNNPRIRKITYDTSCHIHAAQSTKSHAGVSNVNSIATIKVYPNPARDVVHADNISASATYRLLNVIGATVQQGALQAGNNTVSVQHLPAGMYLLEVLCNGQRIVTKLSKQ